MSITTFEENYIAKSQDSSLSPDLYSKKIRKLCAVAGVPFGAPADFAKFMRALLDDKCLAMNFWSLMARMHDLEQGSNDRLLEAIAEGVAGRSVVEVHAAGGEPRRLMKQMALMLAGEDIDLSAAVRVQPTAAATVRGGDSSRMVLEAPALVLTPPAETSLVRDRDERSQPMFEPEAVALKQMVGQRALFGVDLREEEPRANRVPLEGYAVRNAHGSARMIAFAALMAIVAGGVFVARGEGAVLQQKVGPSVHAGYDSAWRGVKGLANWAGSEIFGR